MNCNSCPHMKRITAALLPCQSCDAGRLGGTCHISDEKLDYALKRRVEDVHAQSDGVTNLAPEDEDKLRLAMATLFGLDPIDLLLVQHLFARKQLAYFGDTLIQVARKIGHYKGAIASRSMSHAKKDAISRIFPQIESVFKHIIDESTDTKRNPDAIDDLI